MTDIQLWHAVCMDDEKAFNTLFDRYWVSLYKTAHYYMDDHEVCAEVVNDVFVSVWNRRKNLEITSFSGFMKTSVRYQIYKRRKAAKLNIVFKDGVIADNRYESNEGEVRISKIELDNKLGNYVAQLPKRYQEIFELSRFDGLSNQEISSKLYISKRTVENQLAVAIKHLRTCLKNINIFFL